MSYVVCNHEWSFLEGSNKKHTRTLKAGRHFFPFSFSVDGSLPSTLASPALGGTSIAYKLRAVASRPGFAHNLTHILPVYIHRSYTPEALEYQQTLEIENTWPEKIMYAIMMPHKAWAAGDSVLAVVKFSPLAKGVSVQSIQMKLCESTKVFAKSASGATIPPQEHSRVVTSVKYAIVHGTAVEVDRDGMLVGTPGTSRQGSRPSSSHGISGFSGASSSSSSSAAYEDDGFENNDIMTAIKLPIPSTSNYQTAQSTAPVTPPSQNVNDHSVPTSVSAYGVPPPPPSQSSSSLTPQTVTPSHMIDPIHIAHRIRWSIYISNRDGHISELRCSLPVHILDGLELEEARACSLPSRRMMLSTIGLGSGSDTPEGEEVEDGDSREEADRELPSYTAHVRDRVANMFLPDNATMRVSNPWVGNIGSGSQSHGRGTPGSGSGSGTIGTPNHVHPTGVEADSPRLAEGSEQLRNESSGSLPIHTYTHIGPSTSSSSISHSHESASRSERHTPVYGQGNPLPLDWVNSELMLSLTDEPLVRLGGVQGQQPTGASSTRSRPDTRTASRPASTTHSRAASPEGIPRTSADGAAGLVSSPTAISPVGARTSSPPPTTDAHTHGHPHGVRNLSMSSLFKATMKPFTALAHHGHHKDREAPSHHSHGSGHGHGLFGMSRGSSWSSHAHDDTCATTGNLNLDNLHLSTSPFASRPPSPGLSGPSSSPPSTAAPACITGQAFLHRALTEVPNYAIASRGFIGGVPPLSSMRGLPSYEESAREAASRVDGRSGQATRRHSHQASFDLIDEDDLGGVERASAMDVDASLNATRSRSRERRDTVSDSDLVGRFTRAGACVGAGIPQMLASTSSSESASIVTNGEVDTEDDDGIQIPSGRR